MYAKLEACDARINVELCESVDVLRSSLIRRLKVPRDGIEPLPEFGIHDAGDASFGQVFV